MVSVGRNLIKDHLVQSPCWWQGHLYYTRYLQAQSSLALNTVITSHFKHDIIFETPGHMYVAENVSNNELDVLLSKNRANWKSCFSTIIILLNHQEKAKGESYYQGMYILIRFMYCEYLYLYFKILLILFAYLPT